MTKVKLSFLVSVRVEQLVELPEGLTQEQLLAGMEDGTYATSFDSPHFEKGITDLNGQEVAAICRQELFYDENPELSRLTLIPYDAHDAAWEYWNGGQRVGTVRPFED